MRCSNCSAENPQGAKFCTQCATPCARRCPSCGFDNPPEARFCAQCATPLQAAAPLRPATEPYDPLSAERRHLTVLLCDLENSTGIAAQLDPEEWREIVAGYHRAAAQAIERFGGQVAQYLGDGVMAYFGYPEAHDNDAERAARAGLAILEAIAKLNERTARPRLAARVGIDSGAVVVGAGAEKEADVFGDVPNIAARVQAAAAAGTVMITAATHRLVSGLFVVEDLGAQPLKGLERPVPLYRVIRPSGVRGRLEAAAMTRGLTLFVGREDELRSLMHRWERALDGEGQVALVVGEAGIGKSRLLQRFQQQIAGTPHTWVEAAAGAFFHNTPFFAVAEMLRDLLAWRGDESAEEQLAQLESRLASAGLNPAEAMPLVVPLLNLPAPAKYPPPSLPPEQQRRRLLATLVQWVMDAARAQPTVIAMEDLHWADPSTLELLQLLVEQGATSRLLLLYTARPEFRVRWPLRAHHTQITLNRLSSRNVHTMIEEVAAHEALRRSLPDETIAAVVERAGGVPLFVEELTRAVLESGDVRPTGRQIPVTLYDSLMTRLDRLGPAREVIQIGAVIGSEFSYELLHAVHPIAEAELQRALGSLADAELLYVRGLAPEATYLFKHALIRDAAYEALLKSRRKELHQMVARAIDEKFPALGEARPEVLARHWTEAGETEPAIAEWSRAGKGAEARNAFSEALESYRQALAMLDLLPESSERDLRELTLRQSVVQMLWVTRGYAAPETIEATERAAALADKSGNLAQLVNLMILRGVSAFVSGDLAAGSALANLALDLALREGGPTSLGVAHHLQILTRYSRGDLAGVEKHFRLGEKFFDDPGLRQYPGATVSAFGFASFNALVLGRADVARARSARMAVAANRDNPFDAALSGYYAAVLRVLLREYEQAETLAARALELSEQHQFQLLALHSRCVLGQTRAHLGRAPEGVMLMREGIAGLIEIGARLGLNNFTAHIAEAQVRAGAIADALETVDQALQARNPNPETLRLRGELRLKQGQSEPAEADLREAIALANRVGAKFYELRATMSLARMLAKSGRREEGREKLAGIYGGFTEGFDIADLKDAKSLLDELMA